jgi:paraquat-inducible protein A
MSALPCHRNGAQNKSLLAFHGAALGGRSVVPARKYLSHRDDSDLFRSHLLGLAALVFTASFTIPLLKMLGLAWCASSAMCGSCRFLVGKTRVFRVVEEIGRWSMVDPLTIACFVPVLQFNALIDGHAEPAVVPFSAVVILTTLAAQFFDPRKMWDVAELNR